MKLLKGIITITGTFETGVFYKESIISYAKTSDSLLDDLVAKSVVLSEQTSASTKEFLGSTYDPRSKAEDQWEVTIAYPPVLWFYMSKNQDMRGEEYDSLEDLTYTAPISDFKEIVRVATLVRHLYITQIATQLVLAKPDNSKILSMSPAKPFYDIEKATTLQEMTTYGFTGDQLEFILNYALHEKRISQWKAHLQTTALEQIRITNITEKSSDGVAQE